MSRASAIKPHSPEGQSAEPSVSEGDSMNNNRGSRAIALAAVLVVLSGVPVLFDGGYAAAAAASSQDDWKKEFEDICSMTQDSMSLTPDELRSLVSRCDALRPRIEKLDESQRKVYLKRLQMCRDLLAFVLESKAGK